MDQSEKKWDAEGFWTGGLDLGGWGSRLSLQIESKMTRSIPGSFSTLIIRPSAIHSGLRATSIRYGCCGPKKLLMVPVTSAGSPAIGLGLGCPRFELGPNQLPRRLALSKLLTFPSCQSQKDFETQKFPSPETKGL